MSSDTTFHVAPSGDGNWAVQKAGASKATIKCPTQSEAMRVARSYAKSIGTEVYVHGKDGLIRSRDSYGGRALPRVRG